MTTPRLTNVRISIPGDAEHLDVLRLVARNACARRGSSVDEIDDAALAVHEAGLALIEGGAGRIDMDLDTSADDLDVSLTGAGASGVSDETMSFRIIEALTESFDIEAGPTATLIRLRIRIAS